MARKPKRERNSPSPPPPRGTSDRDKAVDALMALLAEQRFENIGLAEVAGRAGLKLSQLRAEFGSTLAIFAAHIKDIDGAVLAGGDDMTEEPPRERLFDVLMRRLDALDEETIAAEREIFANSDEVQSKPEQARDKIVEGMLNKKFFGANVLLDGPSPCALTAVTRYW